MKIKILPLMLALLPICSLADEDAVNATPNIAKLFPYAAQSHDKEGEIEMSSGTVIKGSNDHKLDFSKKENDEDDIKGKCDEERCTLTNKLGKDYQLSWEQSWKWKEGWTYGYSSFADFKRAGNKGDDIECDYNNNVNTSFSDTYYRNVKVKNQCTIHSSQDVLIAESIEVNGSGTLYLAPGNYWVDKVKLSGSGKIKATANGAINLYVKDSVDLGGQPLGTKNSPVHIYHYNDDDFELETKLTGSLSTKGKLKVSGSGKLDYLREAKSVELQGSAELHLLPMTYWFEKFEVSGGAKVIQPQTGDINLEVKKSVSIKISKLGNDDRLVNINDYGKSVDLGRGLTWYGNLNTHKDLQLHGSSQLYGAVRAKSLDLQGSGKLHLTAGEYWYEDIEMQGSSQIKLIGNRLTKLHVLEDLDLEGSSDLNPDGKPLLVFVYGDDDKDDDKDDGEVDLQGSSSIHGHLYVQGEVELQGGTVIYGAVNVVDLEMEGSSKIIYRRLEGIAANLSHYQLTYNTSTDGSDSGDAMVKACTDEDCTAYTSDIDKLIIKDTYTDQQVLDYPKFNGTSGAQFLTVNTCVQLEIAQATPEPSTTPNLQCIVNELPVDNCKICTDAKPTSNYGFVFGEVELAVEGMSNNEIFEIIDYQGTAGLTDKQGNELKEGSKDITLPLITTHSQVADISLVLQNQSGRQYPVTLGFVPKTLTWKTDLKTDSCGIASEGFNYNNHHQSCNVLSRAGDKKELTLQAYGEDSQGNLIVIENYQADLGDTVNISELNAAHKPYSGQNEGLQSLVFKGENGKGHRIEYTAQHVGLIKAAVNESCAPFAKLGDQCALVTAGDIAILGRTVPASLKVLTKIAGKIEGSKIYAKQPNTINFEPLPQFVVQGLDAQGKPLTSYTGEFAAGLCDNSEIKLETAVPHSGIQLSKPIFDTEQLGNHVFELDASSLVFAKNKRFDETSLHLPLQLTINDHDTYTKGLNSDNNNISSTFLAAKDDTLRFGYLLLQNTETSYFQDGVMKTELRYFDKDGNSESDSDTEYNLTSPLLTATIVTESGADANKPPTLTMEKDHIKVSPQANKQWKGKVTLKVENASKADKFIWLKPAKDDGTGLTDPKADLTLSGRKRGNDKIFNRREVIR
ncbi:MAG: DUF6701 domain-containing protein [Oceanisphaera sp.]